MVYVDAAIYQFGRMKMCHMIADTHEELVQMADAIGVQRKWIQGEGTYREHFDVCKSKRELAIKAGANPITSRELGKILNDRRKRWNFGADTQYQQPNTGLGFELRDF